MLSEERQATGKVNNEQIEGNACNGAVMLGMDKVSVTEFEGGPSRY